jgi:hypothetical protein
MASWLCISWSVRLIDHRIGISSSGSCHAIHCCDLVSGRGLHSRRPNTTSTAAHDISSSSSLSSHTSGLKKRHSGPPLQSQTKLFVHHCKLSQNIPNKKQSISKYCVSRIPGEPALFKDECMRLICSPMAFHNSWRFSECFRYSSRPID